MDFLNSHTGLGLTVVDDVVDLVVDGVSWSTISSAGSGGDDDDDDDDGCCYWC